MKKPLNTYILKPLFAVIVVVFCAGVYFFNFYNTDYLEDNSKYNKESIVMDSSEDIKEYLQNNKMEYNPDIIEIIIYREKMDESENPIKIKALENDFYAKNITKEIITDYSEVLSSERFPSGVIEFNNFSFSDVVKVSPHKSENATFSAIGRFYSKSRNFDTQWLNPKLFRQDVSLKAYPIYEQIEFDLWEDDLFFDDDLGKCKIWQASGYEIIVTKI